MAMAMPKIQKCDVAGCSYNMNRECHAMAITVGGSHPMCDTYMSAAKKGGVADMTGSVGACKVESCKFNKALECSAQGISVGVHNDHADCKTFSAK